MFTFFDFFFFDALVHFCGSLPSCTARTLIGSMSPNQRVTQDHASPASSLRRVTAPPSASPAGWKRIKEDPVGKELALIRASHSLCLWISPPVRAPTRFYLLSCLPAFVKKVINNVQKHSLRASSKSVGAPLLSPSPLPLYLYLPRRLLLFIVWHEWTFAHSRAPSCCGAARRGPAAAKHGLLCLVSGFVQCESKHSVL